MEVFCCAVLGCCMAQHKNTTPIAPPTGQEKGVPTVYFDMWRTYPIDVSASFGGLRPYMLRKLMHKHTHMLLLCMFNTV